MAGDLQIRVGSVALSGGMLIVFLGHLLQVGIWAWLFLSLGEFDQFGCSARIFDCWATQSL